MTMKDIDQIQDKVSKRDAKVYTASEFKAMVRGGRKINPDDVDAVTCGTFGIMSGTMMILTVPVAGPGIFKKADRIELNGVPGNVGPCPNESLGLVDCIVYGTTHRDMDYGGGHLFKDIVEGNPIDVTVWSDGRQYKNRITKKDLPFARMMTTRSSFKNYTCFVNHSSGVEETIFSTIKGLHGNLSEATVSGCGEINPLQNDPDMRYLHSGSSVLLNGAPGMIIGEGTRSTSEKPNLSIVADIWCMVPEYMGGFRTSRGPECMTSVAVAIPVLDEDSIKGLSCLDKDVPMPIADVHDRVPIQVGRYESVWGNTDLCVEADFSRCIRCCDCKARRVCPTNALDEYGLRDEGRCISCGCCVDSCVGHVFSADMGDIDCEGVRVPISLRQSSRYKAEAICRDLKERVLKGDWNLKVF